jgi:hypothetical protein
VRVRFTPSARLQFLEGLAYIQTVWIVAVWHAAQRAGEPEDSA